ncbi:MAG: ribosome small subunit-dependent GTPase A [Clostridiaceae bacterium]|nr:ribosome small subunit-dependent GTPase A [Eubacteriales bacterium]
MPEMTDWGYTGGSAGEKWKNSGLLVSRIVRVHRERFEAVCEKGFVWALPKAGAYFRGVESVEFPAVGDFVLLQYNGAGESLIVETLPRKTLFARSDLNTRKAGHGRVSVEQVIAANFDEVCILMSLNQNYNARRLERYAALAWASGARPAVVLTKADLMEDKEKSAYLAEAMRLAPGARVFALSAVTGEGMEEFRAFLESGKTFVLLGSSGVGKSSLVNALMGEAAAVCGEVREDDARGRHTTTHRELFMLPGGAMAIDTPGMRELGILDADEGLTAAFSEIEALMGRCRFSNCTHTSEPGCAVQRAIHSGALDRARWDSFRSLTKENRAAKRKKEAVKQREKNASKREDRPRDRAYKRLGDEA